MSQAPEPWHRGLAAMLGAAVLVFCAIAFAQRLVSLPLTRHMATHILLMSGLAPVLAIAIERLHKPAAERLVVPLIVAVCLQSAALFLFHAPLAQDLAMQVAWGGLAMHTALLAAAVVFWRSIFASVAARRWQAVAALLVSGKLFCLLGILLVFARRPLYPGMPDALLLADQQASGVLMLAACPATYVLAAFVLCYRGVPGLAASTHAEPRAVRIERSGR